MNHPPTKSEARLANGRREVRNRGGNRKPNRKNAQASCTVHAISSYFSDPSLLRNLENLRTCHLLVESGFVTPPNETQLNLGDDRCLKETPLKR